MKTIHIKKLPSAWHELTLQQIYAVSKLFILNNGATDFVVRFFMAITGWKLLHKKEVSENEKTWYWFNAKEKGKFLVDGDVYASLIKNLEWITSEIKLISVLPEFGPFKPVDVRLYEVSLDEYLFLDSAFSAFVKTKQKKYLNRMLSIVYRTKKETWNNNILDKKARWFWLVPFYKKYVIFLWYVGLKDFLKCEYPFVWQSSGSGEISHAQAILNLLSSLNNGDVTKNKELLKTHVHEAFYELNLKAEQAIKLKSK
jgi:hypothetical protein